MRKTIKLNKDRSIDLLANAATVYRYAQTFHKNLFSELQGSEETASLSVPRLTYVMSAQAEGKDMSTLNEDDFLQWLEGFDAMDFFTNAKEILAVYTGNTEGTSKAKK